MNADSNNQPNRVVNRGTGQVIAGNRNMQQARQEQMRRMQLASEW